MIKDVIKKLPFIKKFMERLNNVNERRAFIKKQLSSLDKGKLILDAGCGSQQFRKFCDHLNYKSQDFGQYKGDDKKVIGGDEYAVKDCYTYGEIDYLGDIWNIDEKDATFDSIMCTEVFEHIPYPIETVKEFSRLLKKDGKLILTAPSNCLRHMDPYFFYSGFSDRWFEKILDEAGFEIVFIESVGDYYSWIWVELVRTAVSHSILAKIILLPSIIYYMLKKKTELSESTLCMGYHVVAVKK